MSPTEILSPSNRAARLTRVAGVSALEVIVAMTLLTTALSVGAQVVVRARRVMDDHRDYRLALDEVANVLDDLSVLPDAELQEQLDALKSTAIITVHLDNPLLTSEFDRCEIGSRITVRLAWGPSDQTPKKVTLSRWLVDPAVEGDQ